jgi:hypothetical protein
MNWAEEDCRQLLVIPVRSLRWYRPNHPIARDWPIISMLGFMRLPKAGFFLSNFSVPGHVARGGALEIDGSRREFGSEPLATRDRSH